MKPVSACIAAGLLVAGCAGQATRPPVTEVTRIPEQGDWFCQLGPSREGWHCVRDPELAEDPVPERLPNPPAPPSPAAPPSSPAELPPREPGPTQAEGLPEAPEPAADSSRQNLDEPAAPPANDAVDAGASEDSDAVPAYLRLAYQPPEPVPLTELPRDFYAVQVLAMNSRQELEAFVRRHHIEGLSSAQVENDGELYYVLLLGIYETLDIARRAAEDLPPPFQNITPWVRPLGSLQAAMARADALTESGS